MPAYNGTHFALAARLIREIPDADQPASPTSNLTIRELMAVRAIGAIRGNVSQVAHFNVHVFLEDCGITDVTRRARLSDSRYVLHTETLRWELAPFHRRHTDIPSQNVVDF